MPQRPRSPSGTGDSLDAVAAKAWAIAGHDLRQPLQSLAFTTRILGIDCTDDERRMAVSSAGLSLESLDLMIGALTEIARLSSGRQSPNRQPAKLEHIVDAVIIDCAAVAAVVGRPIEQPQFSVDIESDPRLLAMAIKGLVLYAIKYGTGDSIVIDVHQRGGAIRLDISYAGPPPGAALDKQAFVELPPVAGDPPRLVQGLGLALVQQLCTCLEMNFEHGRNKSGSQRLSLSL